MVRMAVRCLNRANHHQSGSEIATMCEELSQITGRNVRLAMLLRHKWQDEIDGAVGKVKLSIIPARRRTKMDKWFRRQWFRTMMRDRKVARRLSHSHISATRL